MDQVDRDRFDVDSSADRIDVDRIRIRCGSVCKCGQAFKLKAVETAEKNQKKLQQENLAWILREFVSTVH